MMYTCIRINICCDNSFTNGSLVLVVNILHKRVIYLPQAEHFSVCCRQYLYSRRISFVILHVENLNMYNIDMYTGLQNLVNRVSMV